MALDHFIGHWVEVTKEGFQHIADALGLSAEQRGFFENSKSELTYSRDSENWTIKVGIVGIPESATFTFKLGEVYKSKNIDGSPLTSVVTQDGSTMVERHEGTEQGPFVMDILRVTSGDTMTATSTINGVTMLTVYRRS